MFERMSERLALTAKAIGESAMNAVKEGEQDIFKRIGLIVKERGISDEQIKEFFDIGFIDLLKDGETPEGMLTNQIYIFGDRETKKVLAAYRLEITYTPNGILKGGFLEIGIETKIEDVQKHFFYPEDDESLFKHH